ncbi:prephenate dehydratase [Bacteroidia bacterium]|nr:prephenate dehydratase [Bacteroidia bacterium]GHU95369.1 prephenate dehydratase [Bacteroidia bacterium]
MKKVAIQGVSGAFHEVAAYKFFGNDIEIVPCETFKLECQLLEEGKVDFVMMAIENTIAGSLLPNYSLLNEFKVKIVGEVYLHIQMHLLTLPNVGFEQLEYVYSHPIAIGQCRNYLETLPPHIKIVEKHDTAASAQLIAEQQLTNIAAVAGEVAAKMYGLSFLEKNIQTHKQNFTRFLVLSTQANESSSNNKASLCFEVMHRSGSLAEVLGIFAQHGINLTKIQSIPIIGKPYQYWFYVDVEWSNPAAYNEALHSVVKNVASCSILGEYQHGKIPQ